LAFGGIVFRVKGGHVKSLAFALMLALLLVSCSDDEGVEDSDSSPTTLVAVTNDALVLMYRSVIEAVCEEPTPPALDCDSAMRVSEQFSGDGTTTTETLPPAVIEAAQAELPDVAFIDPENSFETPFIVLGPADMPRPDVVAIKAGQICGNLCGLGTVFYFQYDGSSWEPRTADDLGFDTEVWMS
jgi:hypothetical protein